MFHLVLRKDNAEMEEAPGFQPYLRRVVHGGAEEDHFAVYIVTRLGKSISAQAVVLVWCEEIPEAIVPLLDPFSL